MPAYKYIELLDGAFVRLLPGEVKMGVKNVTLISRLRVVNPRSKANAIKGPTFKDIIFLKLNQLAI